MTFLASELAQSEHNVHGVQARFFANDEFGRGQRAGGIAVATRSLDDNLQRLAEESEHDRVLARIVARAYRVIADFVRRPPPSLALAAVAARA